MAQQLRQLRAAEEARAGAPSRGLTKSPQGDMSYELGTNEQLGFPSTANSSMHPLPTLTQNWGPDHEDFLSSGHGKRGEGDQAMSMAIGSQVTDKEEML